MTAPLVTVLRDRFVAGAADYGAVVGPLGGALQHRFGVDAHTQQGFTSNGRRIRKADLAHGAVTMTCVLFDVDGPGHRREPAWWNGERRKLDRLLGAMPGLLIYTTSGGYRIVGLLPEPIELATREDAAAWSARYLLGVERLARDYEIVADPSCADVGRIFRLPYVVRDGEKQEPELIGDPSQLGAFELPAAAQLLVEATTRSPLLVVGASPAPAPRKPKGVIVREPHEELALERYLTYRRLHDAGAIAQRHPSNPRAYWIRCPNAAQHQNGSDGSDGSTALFLPEAGASGFGIVTCFHGSCAGKDLTALVIDGPTTRREVTITGVGSETDRDGVTAILRLEPADDDGALPLRYLRIDSSNDARWAALFEAANVSDPEDLDAERGDLAAALRELRGRKIALDIGEGASVRRLLAPEVAA